MSNLHEGEATDITVPFIKAWQDFGPHQTLWTSGVCTIQNCAHVC